LQLRRGYGKTAVASGVGLDATPLAILVRRD